MSEIKFRQAIFKDGKFHHWHYWGFCGYRGEFVSPITISGGDYEVKGSQRFVTSYGVLSMRIYEGDIVKTLGLLDNIVGEVVWDEHRFTWAIKPKGWSSGYGFEGLVGHVQVIGNNFENLELLEGGE